MLTLTLAAFSGGLLWAILGIGFLIFIHEYGHYTACRLTRTRVETFSIGFGPRLFGWERPAGGRRRFTWGARRLSADEGAMDFRVAVIPLGGYVKMAGENPGQPRTGAGDEFGSKSIAQRLLIVSAGVIMNAVTALVFYAVAFQGGLPKEPALVGSVEPGSPAWVAGLRTGDRVLEVAGHALTSFQDLRMEAAFLARDAERPILVERDGQRVTLTAKARFDEEAGIVQLGVKPAFALRLGEGADALTVGPRETVEVEGVPAMGGTEALQRIEAAISAGREAVSVRTASGRVATVRVRPLGADEPPPEEPLWRVGIASGEPPVVEMARGAARDLVPGDVLTAVEVGGKRTELPNPDAFLRLALEAERLDALVVTRAGAEVVLPVAGVGDRGAVARLVHDVGLVKAGPVVAPLAVGRTIVAGTHVYRYPSIPAEGRVHAGDRVVEADGKPVKALEDVVRVLSTRRGPEPITLRLAARDGSTREERLTPVQLALVGRLELEAAVHKEPLATTGLLDSLAQGGRRFTREVANTFRTIGSFFTGDINFSKNIAGPITLVRFSKRASEDSFLDLLWWLAYVSVMLAVLNILPVPVLDGGHLIYLAAEKIRGRPLSEETVGKLQWVGLGLLLTLMVFAVKNDITLTF